MTAFSWKNLQAELSTSSYLDASDDLSTQRGLIAAAIPIADRMSNSEEMREVTWKPVRLSLKPVVVSLDSSVVTLKPSPDDDKGRRLDGL